MADSKSRNISNLPIAIPDVPDSPTVSATNVGTSRAFNNGAATVSITQGTGGLPTSYSITTTPTTSTTAGVSGANTITGLASATSYTVSVTATNSAATSAATTTGAFTATTVPQAPTIGTASVTNATTVSIPFTAGATGGSSITSYTTTSSPSISLTTTGTTTPLSVTGTFATNQAYTFTIAAVNANGTSASSSASNSITPLSTAFESIATATGTGSSGTITFSSIPGTYQHLQIRMMGRNTSTSLAGIIRFNSDSGANYWEHQLRGNGTAVVASGSGPNTEITCAWIATSNQAANVHGVSIIDIHDYASTTKNKTIRCLSGMDNNNATTTNERIYLYSGLWLNTNAINSISIIVSGAWSTTSTFALYGIKGA